MEELAGEPSGTTADLGAALDGPAAALVGATVEAEELAVIAAATAPDLAIALDLGAALDSPAAAPDGAAVEVAELADGAAATAPTLDLAGDLEALAVLPLLMFVSDAPAVGDEACRVVVCWLIA